MAQTSFPAQSNAIADPHLFGVTAQGQPSGQTADATNWNPSFGMFPILLTPV
jgi:D-alanyl-D-alanine carboxypeptidase